MSLRGGGSGDSNWGIQHQHQRSSSSPKPASPHTWASVCGPNPSQVVNSRSNCDKPLDTILAAENWGNTVINQEKSWDLSPSNVVDHHVLPSNEWRNASISGTEIWESSVRQKAKPSNNPAVAANATSSSGGGTVGGSSSSSSQSWNHTPSTHIGGTWGEEDADASSLWTGVPMPNGSSSHSVFSTTNASNGNWGSNSKADAIGSNGSESNNSSSWKDATQQRSDETSSRNGNQSNNWAPWGEAVSEARAPLKPESTSNERLGTTLWGCDSLGTNSNSNMSSNSNNSSSSSSNHNHNTAPVTKSTIRSNTISSDSATSWKKESTSSNCSGWDEGEGGSHFSASSATFTINGSTNGSTTSNASQGTNDKMSVFEDTSTSSKGRDDGTAVWGNPQVHGQQKIRRWKEEQSNIADANAVNMLGSTSANGLLAVPPDDVANGSNGPVVIGGVSSTESPGLIRLPSVPSMSNTASKSTEPWIKPTQNSGHRSTSAWGDIPMGNGTAGNSNSSSSSSSNCNNRPTSEWGQASVDAPSDAKNHRGWGEASDSPSSPGPMWGKSPKNPPSSWSDGQVDTSSWSGSKQKPLTKEMIYASKQFRLLTENLGYKKDDVEMALRASNMNIDDSLHELKSWASSEDKPKMSPVPGNTPPSLLLSGGLSNASLHNSSSSNSSSIVPSNCGTNNAVNTSSICAALRAPNSLPNQQSLPSVNQMKSALGVKSGQLGPGASLSGSLNGGTSQPSDRQLYHLVNQIQLAVQSGHLNAQILNQPLAPQTVHLIYTLLQSIKHLLTLQGHLNKSMQQQSPANQAIQPHLHVQITKTKQTISNLQNQIHLTQSMFLKQQSQLSLNALTSNSNSSSTVTSPVNSSSSQAFSMDVLKSQMTQEVTSSTHQLPNEFGNLSLKDPPNQSRLKTWKLPTYDKTDVDSDLFSRAPGSSKSAHSSGLPSRSDSTWSTLGSAGDCWSTWSGDHQASNDSLFKEHQPSTSVGAAASAAAVVNAAVAAAAAAAAASTASSANPTHTIYLSELAVPEFEPGKPWKGSSQLKSIEDDPTVTPGSVNRSPLSVNNIFNTWSKGSPTESTANDSLPSLSFSSSNTWSFTPSASSSALSTFASCDPTKSGGNKGSVTAWSSIGETPSSSDSLWGNNSTSNAATTNSNTSNKPRGPPPGLSAKTQMNGQFVTQEYSLPQLL